MREMGDFNESLYFTMNGYNYWQLKVGEISFKSAIEID